MQLLLDFFYAFRGCLSTNWFIIFILEGFYPLCKVVEFSLSKDVGSQDVRLIVRVSELEWPDGLRLDDLEVDVPALQTIEDV